VRGAFEWTGVTRPNWLRTLPQVVDRVSCLTGITICYASGWGILTTEPSTPNSHTAILARSYRVPFVYLRTGADRERAQALVGHTVALSTTAGTGGARHCGLRFIDLEGHVDAATEAALRALAQPPPLSFPAKRHRGALSLAVDGLGPANSDTVGGKAANFGVLRASLPEVTPVAVALTFDLWDAFLNQTLPGGQRLADAIDQRLAGHGDPPDLPELDDDLRAIRTMIEDHAEFLTRPAPGHRGRPRRLRPQSAAALPQLHQCRGRRFLHRRRALHQRQWLPRRRPGQ
jgi:hypothetical protein